MHSQEPTPIENIAHFSTSPSHGLSALRTVDDGEREMSHSALQSSSTMDQEMTEMDEGIARHPKLPGGSSGSGFGIANTPGGGDCKRLCARHARMNNGTQAQDLQRSIEGLPDSEKAAVNALWSLFSSARGVQRTLMLRGLLTICCPSQLSFLSEQIKMECRIDPLDVLPRELALRCFAYLDAFSLGRAAQVSRSWRSLADDDTLWRTMCEQHIERKCEKCGWGLPLLEKRRRARAANFGGQAQDTPGSSRSRRRVRPSLETIASDSGSPGRTSRKRTADGEQIMDVDNSSSRASTPDPMSSSVTSIGPPKTRPWKLVYCERLLIERNWRKGSCSVKVFTGHTDAITCLQLDETLSSPTFPVLITGSWDRTARVWNAETGALVQVLRGHTRGVRALQFDNTKLITAGMDATLKIWNWRTGECFRTLNGHRDAVICLAYDANTLVSGSADATVKVWDFSTGETTTFRGHREWVNSVKIWSPDDQHHDSPLSSALVNGTTPDFTTDSTSLGSTFGASSARVKLVFSASDDGTVRVWDLASRQCVRVLEGHVAQVQSLAIVTQEADQSDHDASLDTLMTPAPSSHPTDGFFASTSSGSQCSAPPVNYLTGSGVAAGAPNAATFLGAATDGQPRASLTPIDWGSTPQPLLVSASLDNTLKTWDIDAGTVRKTMFGHVEGVWGVAADKLRILSASHDRTVKVWDRDGRCLHTFVGHRGAVTTISLLDDKAVTGGDDGDVRLWDFGPDE